MRRKIYNFLILYIIMKKPKKRAGNKVRYGTISLPAPLIEKVKKRIKGTGMPSVSSYVAFVLRQILASSPKTLIASEETGEIKAKLKSLGY
tara:strand:+ start:676 stop:948 length:273 start_codon:yes stop_codon:yes gene_type:complete